MRLIIAGSRTFSISVEMITEILNGFDLLPDEIVCGMCDGVDLSGYDWAKHFTKDIKEFPYLSHLGKAGGPVRNNQMAEYSDVLLLIWDGESNGSKSILKEMKKLKKPVYEVILRKHNV